MRWKLLVSLSLFAAACGGLGLEDGSPDAQAPESTVNVTVNNYHNHDGDDATNPPTPDAVVVEDTNVGTDSGSDDDTSDAGNNNEDAIGIDTFVEPEDVLQNSDLVPDTDEGDTGSVDEDAGQDIEQDEDAGTADADQDVSAEDVGVDNDTDGQSDTAEPPPPVDPCENTVCDDGDGKTVDACDPATGGCVFTPVECDDENACTVDAWDNQAQGCVHAVTVCDDKNLCTTDTCESSTGCAFTPIDCDDGNACTEDKCYPMTGECVYPLASAGTPCDDGNACTLDDACQDDGGCMGAAMQCEIVIQCDCAGNGWACAYQTGACLDGACENIVVASDCDDGDACTTESCDLADPTGCAHSPACDDGNICTGDLCDSETGECYGTYPWSGSDCDDGDPWTLDSCDPVDGCQHAYPTVGDGVCWGLAGTPLDSTPFCKCYDDNDPSNVVAAFPNPTPGVEIKCPLNGCGMWCANSKVNFTGEAYGGWGPTTGLQGGWDGKVK